MPQKSFNERQVRMKTLLGKLDSVRRSEQGGYKVSDAARETSRKFAGRAAKIFKSMPKSLEWRSFYRHDLPILIDFCEEVREASRQNRLNRSQTRALEKLRSASKQEFQRVAAPSQSPPNSEKGHVGRDSSQIELRDLSGREIEEIADKAAKKERLKELNRLNLSTVDYEPGIIGISMIEHLKANARIAFLNADWSPTRRAYASESGTFKACLRWKKIRIKVFASMTMWRF